MAERDEKGHFLPGNAEGRSGRPPNDKSITVLTRAQLEEETTVPVKDADGKEISTRTVTYLQLFVESQIKRAINGDPAAAKNIWDRIEGRVLMQLEHSTPTEGFRFVTEYIKPAADD